MSRLTDGRISHLAHLIVRELRERKLVDFGNETQSLRETKKFLEEFFNVEDQVDDHIRKKIQSLSRGVQPGSREWDILYKQYREEELRKHRR